ncbi:hypothetical protein CKAH01_12958 [Colletotrichum kahawae]|uniref:Uncharacterized protein n=1 Tax=Colletotrichum kahawae TaxID=34407 RepID=A0AAD9YPH8_COLKA|nr:hypothetical protein CKAH01_12958 [Colletotrichum kahawae]
MGASHRVVGLVLASMNHAKLRPVSVFETGCQQHTRAQQETPQVTAAAVYVSEFFAKDSPDSDPAPNRNPPITGLAPLLDPQHLIGGKPWRGWLPAEQEARRAVRRLAEVFRTPSSPTFNPDRDGGDSANTLMRAALRVLQQRLPPTGNHTSGGSGGGNPWPMG